MMKERVARFLLLVSALTIGLTDASIYISTPPSVFNFTPSHSISLQWTYDQSAVAPAVTEFSKWDGGKWSELVVHHWLHSITSTFPTANIGRLHFLSPFTITFTPTLASDVGSYRMMITNDEGNPPTPTQHVSVIELRIAVIPGVSSSHQQSLSVASPVNYETISSGSTETFSTTSTTFQEPVLRLTTSQSIAATMAHQTTTSLASSITQSVLETSKSSHDIMSGSFSVTKSSVPTTGQAISTISHIAGPLIVTASSLSTGQAISTEGYMTTHELLATLQIDTMSNSPTKSDVSTLNNNRGTESQTTTSRPLIATTSLSSTHTQMISIKSYTTIWELGKTSQMKKPNTVPMPINQASIDIPSISSNGVIVSQIITPRPVTDGNGVTHSQTSYPVFQSTTPWLQNNRTIAPRPVTESNRSPPFPTATSWLRNNGTSTANGSLHNSMAISATKMYLSPTISGSMINHNASAGGRRRRNETVVMGLSIGLPLIAFVLFAGAAYAYIIKMKMINKTYPSNAINMTDFQGSNEVKASKYIAVGEERVITNGTDSATSGDLFHCKKENIQL